MKNVVYLFLGMLLSACVFSDQPLSKPSLLTPNSPLIGNWTLQDENENKAVILHIGIDKRVLKLVKEEIDKNGSVKESFSASSHQINGNNYLSIKTINDNGKDSYIFCKYIVSNSKTLELQFPNTEFVLKAVANDLITGSGRPNDIIKSVQLTASQDELSKFISVYSESIFAGKTASFKRVR